MQEEMIHEDHWIANLELKPHARGQRIVYIAATALAIAGLTISLGSLARASSVNNLIQDPGFQPTNGKASPIQLNVPANQSNPGFSRGAVIGSWSAFGFVILLGPDSSSPSLTNADVGLGADNQFVSSPPPHLPSSCGFFLYGPGGVTGDASCNGGQAVDNGLTIGPHKGNFLAFDADPNPNAAGSRFPLQGSISQTINGLRVGVPTTLTFNWAAGQQATFNGATFEMFQVSLCPTSGSCPSTDIFTTPRVDIPSHGFAPWMAESFMFTPSSSTEVLSFLAIGSNTAGLPAGLPPFALLDGGVTLTQQQQAVPEPKASSLLGIAFAALAGLAYRRRKWLCLQD